MADLLERLRGVLAERYRVEREVGRGGMATVYLAFDLKHHRKVAIKVLKPELAASLGPERFLREIEIAAQLAHPHILPLHDSGEAGGLLYYVMPYVEGESLRDRLDREKQLPIADALRITHEVADALSHAHSLGVVHRDIKPANILFEAGHAILADFGVARAVSAAGGTKLTETGLAVGTPAYMSPEQASGDWQVDPRGDIYALGCVVYEMLTGDPPFAGSTPQAVLARKSVERALPLRTVRDAVPPGVEAAVLKALARLPADRFATATQFSDALARASTVELASPETDQTTFRRALGSAILRNRWVATSGALGFVAVLTGGAWLWARESDVRWARNVALPEAMQSITQGNTFQAFRLLREAALHLPDDPTLEELLVESTIPVTIRTTPPDADVYVRDFFEPGAWQFLGSAPLEDVRLPVGLGVARVSRQGFQPKEVMTFTQFGEWHFSLQPIDQSPPDMVHVNGGRLELFATEVTLGDFWIDQHEVTNEAFKSFVDQGGYDRREFWTERIVADGEELDREASRLLFRDRTGRPGPATWSVGAYPDGTANEPVGGVSWYEAAAYCASVGKRLPTIYHWYRAAVLPGITDVVSLGNFTSSGPEGVGHPLRLGFHGTYDMAGNVKEWVWNEASSDRRYILGGGWTEPSYTFHDADAQRPWDREPTFGIRCARYATPPPADQTGRLARASRDWRQETPAAADLFAVYRGLYEYDRTPLDPRVDSVREEFEHWSVEHVSFSAPYGNERIPARVFLPAEVRPPYQTVIYFPGGSAFRRSPAGGMSGEEYWFLFMVRSGRAVVVPVYKGAYERYVGPTGLPNIWRDVMVYAGKDLRRAVDYVESRPDLDAEKLAYFGLSMGAAVGPIMTAVEPRFAASILLGGGLYSRRRPPESEQFHFAPRVTAPTLMINGRHDFFFPLETSQEPMFELLGTPDKEYVVFESGHIPREREEVIREVLDWLDRYLGPVEGR